MMKLIVGNSKHWPMLVSALVLIVCISGSVGRNIPQDFDLEPSAAEPRPIFIETGPSAEALPLVFDADAGNGPLSDASEKVEKVLKPALSFAYNPQKFVDQDREAAESKQDQNTEAVNYYKYLESDDKKDGAAKEKTEEQAKGDLEAGGEGAESKHHDKKHDDGGNHNAEFEKGGGKDFHAHHHGEHGDKGEKGYKGHHHHEKALNGHHDKENHHHGYGEEGAHKKEHHHEDGYHGEHHKSHGGKKGAKFSEEGQHNKGHSTKGSHSIHKKDEYEKKTEFFEEDHEGGDSEKHGGFSHKNEYKKGGHQKSGHKKGGHQEGHHGRKAANAKGGHYKDEHGHDSKGGHEHHHQHDTKHGHKQGASDGKKWGWRESKDSGGGGNGGGHDGGGAHSHQNYIVQAAPKNGQTAHSHQSYAVQNPPPNHVVAVAKSPYQTYQIAPISTFVLPLEGEPEIGGQSLSDGAREPSQYSGTVVPRKNLNLKKRRPSPTEEFLADNPYSSEETREPDSSPSTISPVELFIRQETLKYKTLEKKPQSKEDSNSKPEESKKVTKKRRLKKKKKVQKDAKAEASGRSARGLPDCLHGHKREKNTVPQESSHSFVIVAADDAA